MSKVNQTETNIPDFYDYYAKKAYWSDEEAVALSLNINPEKIISVHSELVDDKGKKYEKEFCTNYDSLIELIKEALYYNKISRKMCSKADPLSFINWCKVKDIPFPRELEKLVKKYTPNYVDYEARYQELETRIRELETKNIKLTSV